MTSEEHMQVYRQGGFDALGNLIEAMERTQKTHLRMDSVKVETVIATLKEAQALMAERMKSK